MKMIAALLLSSCLVTIKDCNGTERKIEVPCPPVTSPSPIPIPSPSPILESPSPSSIPSPIPSPSPIITEPDPFPPPVPGQTPTEEQAPKNCDVWESVTGPCGMRGKTEYFGNYNDAIQALWVNQPNLFDSNNKYFVVDNFGFFRGLIHELDKRGFCAEMDSAELAITPKARNKRRENFQPLSSGSRVRTEIGAHQSTCLRPDLSPVPSPVPSHSPVPSPSSVPNQCTLGEDGNYPMPTGTTCPSCWTNVISFWGIAPPKIGAGRITTDLTPHSKKPYLAHRQGQGSETHKNCQPSADSSLVPDIKVTKPNGSTEICPNRFESRYFCTTKIIGPGLYKFEVQDQDRRTVTIQVP